MRIHKREIAGASSIRVPSWLFLAMFLLVAWTYTIQPAAAGFNATIGPTTRYFRSVQVWYDGYWEKVDWVNGSTRSWPATNGTVQGRIVLLRCDFAGLRGLDQTLRELAPLKPLAALVGSASNDAEGQLGGIMYFRSDARERKSINFPVAHAYFDPDFDWTKVPDGTFFEVQFEENPFLIAHETHFQAVIGAVLSLWEISLVIFGSFRIYQFLRAGESWHILLSVGPLCLILEVISSSIRFAHMSVDPIWNERFLPDTVHLALVSIHLPFSYAAGILLTFFWAEILNKSKFKDTPFIAKYRKTSIGVISALFTIEILATIFRTNSSGTVYTVFVLISLLLYIGVALALALSFIICFVAIYGRLRNTKLRSNHTDIMTISIRFGLSIFGYISLCCFIIAVGTISLIPYATHLVYDMAHVSLNFVATIQIVLLKPPVSSASQKAWSTDTRFPMSTGYASSKGAKTDHTESTNSTVQNLDIFPDALCA